MAAYLFGQFEIEDYEGWKAGFDSDPVGRRDAANGHRIYRSTESPNDVFVAVEFPAAEEASSFRERLLASQALDNVTVKTQPTVVEEADAATY